MKIKKPNTKKALSLCLSYKKTKKIYLILVLMIFFILTIILIEAYFYEINFACQKEICIQDQKINWSIYFENKGSNTIKIVAIELVENINQTTIANVSYEYDPFDSNKQNYFVIYPHSKAQIHIQDKVPKPNKKNELVYIVCITTVLDSETAQYLDSYTKEHCYLINESIPIFECVKNRHCKTYEICEDNKCQEIECEYCQHIINRTCHDYECCNSTICNPNESCIEHKCITLNCSPQEKIFNHSCIKLNCSYDEYANHTCIKLNCSYDEYIANHTCIKLNCSYDEYIANHTCIKLNCSHDEYTKNSTCIKLKCKYNETPFNHSCIPLSCGFFQKRMYHRCLIDKQFIFKFMIELIVIILIIFVLILNIKKYESKHKNKKQEVKNEQK